MPPCGVGRVRQRSDSDGACGWSGRGRVGLVLRPAGMHSLQYIGALSGGIPKFIRVAWGAFVPVGYTPPCPGFQPWENCTWWWSRFKEPPNRVH